MNNYYVNNNPNPGGEHEVHKEGCSWLDLVSSKTPLGKHSNCKDAVKEAKKYHADVDGCKHCIPECHTR